MRSDPIMPGEVLNYRELNEDIDITEKTRQRASKTGATLKKAWAVIKS